MNQAILTGNLTADIEVRELGDTHLSKFTLACNEGERVLFLPVEAWRMPHLVQYLSKGSKVLISGNLKQENWETEAGDKRSRIVLTAHKIEFLSAANSGGSTDRAQQPSVKRRGRPLAARREKAVAGKR